jgi:DNA-binding FadR family transcriptional regulator
MKDSSQSALESVAARLRALSLSVSPGDPLGAEEGLITQFACSRSTIRQAARLLEREGVINVRRGQYGGYFAARPDASTIERAVSTYLEMLNIDTGDVTVIASALWVEAMRKAASVKSEVRQPIVEELTRQVESIKDDASFPQVLDAELRTQNAVFKLSESDYIKLIFDINLEFASRNLTLTEPDGQEALDPDFVRDWRQAKLLELGALAKGSRELAAITARYSRKVWQHKVGVRISELGSLAQAG